MRAAVAGCALGLLGCATATEPASTDTGTSAWESGPPDAASDAVTVDVGPVHAAGARCTPEAIPSTGFVANEVYVESSSPDCLDGPCVVYHLVGIPTCVVGACAVCGGSSDCGSFCDGQCVVDTTGAEPNSLARTFCSCRCGAAGSPDLPLCTCPGGMRCVPDTDPGGGYCAPDALAVAAGVCFTDAECPIGQHCDASRHCG